jgi:hypothetical protein
MHTRQDLAAEEKLALLLCQIAHLLVERLQLRVEPSLSSKRRRIGLLSCEFALSLRMRLQWVGPFGRQRRFSVSVRVHGLDNAVGVQLLEPIAQTLFQNLASVRP